MTELSEKDRARIGSAIDSCRDGGRLAIYMGVGCIVVSLLKLAWALSLADGKIVIREGNEREIWGCIFWAFLGWVQFMRLSEDRLLNRIAKCTGLDQSAVMPKRDSIAVRRFLLICVLSVVVVVAIFGVALSLL
jgi:hypothetical protein